MNWTKLGLLALVTLAPLHALGDGRDALKQASRHVDEGEFEEAKALLSKVAGPGNPAPLRAEANQRLGCLSIDMMDGGQQASQEKARRHFRAALEFDPKADSLASWGSSCRQIFAEVKATFTSTARATPAKTRSKERVATADPQALARERAEREAQQAKFEELRRQLGEIQRKQQLQLDAMKQAETPRDDEQLRSLQASIAQLQADLDARDARIAELIRTSTSVPAGALAPGSELELRSSSGRNPVPSLILGGAAVLGGGAGLFFGSRASSDKQDFDATPFQRNAWTLAESGQRNQLTANILFGTAAGLAVTAAIVYFVQDPGETE